eukprot:8566340-Pyramimonas_sp.AAC.1
MPRCVRHTLNQEDNIEQRAVKRRRRGAPEGGVHVSLEEGDGLFGLQRQAPGGFEEQVRALGAAFLGHRSTAVEL